MIALGDLVLLRPVWLAGLGLTAALVGLVLRHRRSLAGWADVVEPRLLAFLASRGQVRAPRGAGRAALLAAVAGLCALALAGPATRSQGTPGFRNHEVIFLLLDLSRSMTRGGSLDDAQAVAALVLAEAGTRPVALALYAGESYLVSPPTSDPRTLETTIAVLSAETLPDGGSRPDRALTLARRVLAEADAQRADLILVSDGGGLGPDAEHAARVLKAEGVRVSAVFVAPRTAPIEMPAPSRAAMARLAEAGGGALIEADETGELARLVADTRGHLTDDPELAPLLFDDLGRWLLWPALALALFLFRRRRPA